MKASMTITARGTRIITEPDSDPHACCDCEEIARFEIEVPDGTKCDICEETIREAIDAEAGEKPK